MRVEASPSVKHIMGLLGSPGIRQFVSINFKRQNNDPSMPTQAANATTINPGITRRAKERPPLMPARNILLIVFVESPAKIGNTASAALIFPAATSEATEIAAEWVSTKPARAAATIMPVSPNHSLECCGSDEDAGGVKANTKAAERLNARPLCASLSVFCCRARIVKTVP